MAKPEGVAADSAESKYQRTEDQMKQPDQPTRQPRKKVEQPKSLPERSDNLSKRSEIPGEQPDNIQRESAEGEKEKPDTEVTDDADSGDDASVGKKGKRREWGGSEKGLPFPVVGIGASAGGIESIEKLFSGVPKNPGMAFVVILHLMPDHESMLPDLIARVTSLPVVQITDGMAVEKNRVHVIPPGFNLSLADDHFHLTKMEHYFPPATIDHFFRSLAEVRGETAVGIVLSGAGTDGAMGVRAIREKMGLAIAEEPTMARFRSMPDHAIMSGLVDKVLPAGEIAPFLVQLMSSPRPVIPGDLMSENEAIEQALRRIFHVLRSRSGHDFSGYKRNTVLRRIERRIIVQRLDSMNAYAEYLQSQPVEAAILFKELLIGVTRFFREHEVFDVLKDIVFPELLAGKPDGAEVRLWVPGVATGEEAYSLAMVIKEVQESIGRQFSVQIFATDLNDSAIDYARTGMYPPSIAEDVGVERLERFFERAGDQFKIRREIREIVVFAVQDLIKDPPFTRLDLLSCRNLLIYLNASVQHKLMPLFHYALRPNGYLVLGTSETVGEFASVFDVIDSKWKIYKVRETVAELAPRPHFAAGAAASHLPYSESRRQDREPILPRMTADALLRGYAPPSVVIDRRGQVLYVHGRTGRFLELAEGKENKSIFDMAREGLRMHLPAITRQASTAGHEVVRKGLKVRTDGGEMLVNLVVRPLGPSEQLEELLLVSFEEAPPPAVEAPRGPRTPEEERDEVRRTLESELRDTRENLQTTIEELEGSNEELRAANEEYQSITGELKSTNEEVETSREELQSLNEELSTLNRELQERLEELARSHKEVQSYLNGLEVPTVFLDRNLRVRRFTIQARELIHLIESDVGRPMADIAYDLEDKTLLEDARKVFETLAYEEKEVRTVGGHWYLRRIIPYRSQEKKVEGVVINFVDIHELKMKRLALEDAYHDLKLADLMVQAARTAVVLLDTDLRIRKPNRSFCDLMHMSEESLVGKSLLEIGDNGSGFAELVQALGQLQSGEEMREAYEQELELPELGRRRSAVFVRRVQVSEEATSQLLVEISPVASG